MGTLTMTIAAITAPSPGKPRGAIKGTDGTTIGCWQEKIGLFALGKTYEIEFTESEYNGRTLKNVKAAKETGSIQAPAISSATNGRGMNGSSYKETSPKDAERMFVCAIVTAFIKAGKVNLVGADINKAVELSRNAWAVAFGPATPIAQRAIDAMRAKPIDEFPNWYQHENPAAGLVPAE